MGLMGIIDGARSWRDALRASPLDIPINGQPLSVALSTSTLTLKNGAVATPRVTVKQADADALRGASQLLSTIFPGVERNLTTISTSSTMDGFLALMAEAQVDDWAKATVRERQGIARELHEVWKGQMGDSTASWGRVSGWYLDESKQLALDARMSASVISSHRSGMPATAREMAALEALVHEGAHADSPFRAVEAAGRSVPRWIEEGQAVVRAEGNVHRAAMYMTGAIPDAETSLAPTVQYQNFANLLTRIAGDAGFDLRSVEGRHEFHQALAQSANTGTMYGPWQMLATRIGEQKGASSREIRQFLASTDGGPEALAAYLKILS